jgi:hypothetical protein
VGAGEDILVALKRLEAKVDKLIAAQPVQAASDRELDSSYGNPKIKFSLRQWTGRDYKGALMSECEPEFLDMYAEALLYSADHPKPDADPKYTDWNRKDAARAAGWARRLRAAPAAPPRPARPRAAPRPPPPQDGEDIPWGDDGPVGEPEVPF